VIEGCPNCPWREKYDDLKNEVAILQSLVSELYLSANKMDIYDIITNKEED